MKKNRGTILTDLLLSLTIGVLVFAMFVSILDVYKKVKIDSTWLQNEIGLVQLQYHLMLAYDIEVLGDELSYIIVDDKYVLRLVNERLMQQPGTLIFLLDIQEVEFVCEDDAVFINYVYKEKNYNQILVYNE